MIVLHCHSKVNKLFWCVLDRLLSFQIQFNHPHIATYLQQILFTLLW